MSKNKYNTVLTSKFLSWILSRIYIFLFLIVEQLPLRLAYLFGRFLGGLLFYLTRHRRKIVENNILTLKNWAERKNFFNISLNQENQSIAKEIYQSNAGNFFYSFSLMNKSKIVIEKHIKIGNLDLLKKSLANNKGVILLFAHSGPFELTVMLPKIIPSIFNDRNMAAMYRPFNNRYMNSWYLKRRCRFGAQLFSREDGFFRIIRHIKNGGLINIAYDIRMNQGEKVEFFDKLASTSKIPYSLHKATGAPVIAISFIRIDDLSWEIQFNEIASVANEVCSEIDLLKTANNHLEEKIFKNPFDYFFFQDRYK